MKSFLDYNINNIKNDIDKIIFVLAFFYKDHLIWEKVLFNEKTFNAYGSGTFTHKSLFSVIVISYNLKAWL